MKIGDKVRTKCGGRLPSEGPFYGIILKFTSKFRGKYQRVSVKKIDSRKEGQIVTVLEKNLEVIKP